MTSINQKRPYLIATLLGIALPALIIGRGLLAVIVCLAFLLIVVDAIKTASFPNIRQAFISEWKRPLGVFLIGVFTTTIPSVFAAEAPLHSFTAPGRTLGFCFIVTLFYVYLKNHPNLSAVWIKWFIISSFLAISLAYFSQFIRPELYWFLHLKGIRADPLDHTLKGYTALALFMIPLLIFGANRSQRFLSVIALLSAISLFVLILLLANRSVIAGFLAAIICLSIAVGSRPGSKRQALMLGGFSVLHIGVILWWLQKSRDPIALDIPIANYFIPTWLVDFQRQTIWSHALDIALQSPWFGRGANTINHAPGASKYLQGTQGLHVIPAHPHNWPIELFAEIGVFGLIALVAFILFCMTRMLYIYRKSANPGVLTAITIFAGYWCSGLFNFSFWAAWWQVSFILAMALALSARPIQTARHPPNQLSQK